MTRLHIANQWHDAEQGCILPFLGERFDPHALLPNLVLCPYPVLLNATKASALEAQLPLMGVHFWTPNMVRTHLRQRLIPERQILDPATASFLFSNSKATHTALDHSLQRDPQALLSAWQTCVLSGAKWEDKESQPWIDAFLKQKAPALTGAEGDLEVLAQSQKSPAIFHRTLIMGFQAQHWLLRPLLRSVCFSSLHTEVLFFSPHISAETSDLRWLASWEAEFGEPQVLPSADYSFPLQERITLWERQESCAECPSLSEATSLQADSVLEEAESVIAWALKQLEQPTHQRVGIVVPQGHILGREITSRLERLEIPHFDAIGKIRLQALDEELWRGWLAWQEQGSLIQLGHWLQRLASSRAIQGVDECIQGILAQTLSENEQAFRSQLAQTQGRVAQWIIQTLDSLTLLPAEGTVLEYIELCQQQLRSLDWNERADFLQLIPARWQFLQSMLVTRSSWVRWIQALADSQKNERDDVGNHPFSKLWIMDYEQAEFAPWDAVALCGLAHEVYPSPPPIQPWLSDEALQRMNASASQDGGVTLPPDRSWLLNASNLHGIARRHITHLLSHVKHTALISTHKKSADEREATPSELFLTLRSALDPQHRQHWMPQNLRLEFSSNINLDDFIQTHHLRADPSVPFDSTHFGCGESYQSGVHRLPCKLLAQSLQKPTESWYRLFLQLKHRIEILPLEAWRMAQGTWVHHMLRAVFNPLEKPTWVSIPAQEQRHHNLNHAFQNLKHTLVKEFLKESQDHSFLASSILDQSHWVAKSILNTLEPHLQGYHVALTEWSLPRSAPSHLQPLWPLSGRIDLILAPSTPTHDQILPPKIWIIDFKTSYNDQFKSVTLSKARKGKGLQLLLYGHMARLLGAEEIAMSYLMPDPHLGTVEDALLLNDELWEALAHIADNGILGSQGETDKEDHGVPSYLPMATVWHDPETLKNKWNLTHHPILHC